MQWVNKILAEELIRAGYAFPCYYGKVKNAPWLAALTDLLSRYWKWSEYEGCEYNCHIQLLKIFCIKVHFANLTSYAAWGSYKKLNTLQQNIRAKIVVALKRARSQFKAAARAIRTGMLTMPH